MKVFLVTKTKIIWGLSALAASLLAFIFTFTNSFLFADNKKKLPIYKVSRDEKIVSISFDAAWGNEYTQTLLDVLKLLNAYKINFLAIVKQLNEEVTDEEFKNLENVLEEFINNPNNNFIKNVTITDTKDIKTIILDKYNLVNINITEEQLEDTNIESFISTISKIITSIYLTKSNLKYEDLNSACEMKEILKKEDYSLDE